MLSLFGGKSVTSASQVLGQRDTLIYVYTPLVRRLRNGSTDRLIVDSSKGSNCLIEILIGQIAASDYFGARNWWCCI